VPANDRAGLDVILKEALGRYREAATQSAPAAENLGHVERMLASIDSRTERLAELGINAQVTKAGILFSDLGKNGSNLAPLAQELFPAEFANESTRGLAFFKAFLLHEIPGRKLFREMAAERGLSESTIRAVEAANVGHNGPGAAGSWWQQNWDAQIKDYKGQANLKGAHGDLAAEYLGKAYPKVASLEGALHTGLDRRDQGTRDGSLKIMSEVMEKGATLKEAFAELFGENQRKTQLQFDALRALHPKVFELDIVLDAERSVQETLRYRNHVSFNADGTKARVHLPDGRVIETTTFEGFRDALRMIDTPAQVRYRNPKTRPLTIELAREQAVTELRQRTVPQLLAQVREANGKATRPYSKANLIAQLSGVDSSRVRKLLRTPARTPRVTAKTSGVRWGGNHKGASRRLSELAGRGAQARRRR
jgi:hypothetical protein